MACRRCCRFADPQDAQTPVFSTEEVRRALTAGASAAWFQPAAPPSQTVRVGPHPCGGTQCPALEPTRHHCRIYPERPLDCRLYPFVVTRDASGRRLLLAVDTKCPYVQQLGAGRVLRDYGWYLLRLLESPSGQRLLVENPGLAGRPRPEFWVVAPIHDPSPPPAPEPPTGFVPLASRWAEFDRALTASGRPLSAYHRAAWAAWDDLLRCWWGPIGAHHDGVVAEQAGGYFLALPPLGPPITRETMEEAFARLGALNGGAPVSRVDNLPEALAERCRAWGYAVSLVEREYLYERAQLERQVEQGAAEGRLAIRPYRPEDLDACRRVYTLWALRRQSDTDDTAARAMLRDGFYAHRRWLEQAASLGVVGWVAEDLEGLCGYTLGAHLSSETGVILAEITTLEHEALPAMLAAALCRALAQPLVNTMGDALLPALARRKAGAHPFAVRPVFSVAKPS